MSHLLSCIADNQNIDLAFDWLCKAREDYSPNSDVWDLRYHWDEIKPSLQAQLIEGSFRFSVMQQYRFPDQRLTLWTAVDALILRAMAQVLSEWIRPKLNHVYHVKGQDGISGALALVRSNLSKHAFVLKTDIEQYYESISHESLLTHLETFIPDQKVLALLRNAIHRTETYGGLYWDVFVGIPMGSALSPLLGAVALHAWDQAMSKLGVVHARFMDDLIVLTKTRHQLKRVIRVTHQILKALKLKLHPDKTYIGRIKKGFDYLGFHLKPPEVRVSLPCLLRAAAKARLLFEQTHNMDCVWRYWRRFLHWVEMKLQALRSVQQDFHDSNSEITHTNNFVNCALS